MTGSVRYLLPLLACVCAAPGFAKVSSGETARPLLPVFKDAAEINTNCAAGLAAARTAIDALATAKIRPAERSILTRFDAIDVTMENVWGPMEIAAATHTEKPVREAAEACVLQLSKLQNALYQNEALFARLKTFKPKSEAERQVWQVALEKFEDSGAALPPKERTRAREIQDQLSALSIEFQRNTRENLETVYVTPAELDGMPQAYRDAHKPGADGRIALQLNYPDYVPFMENAHDAAARQRYYMAFNRIGGDRNLAILDEAAGLRKELARLFGKPSYAHYVIARRMAGTPNNVMKFLDGVRDRVMAGERRDLDILRGAKAEHLGKPLAETGVERWDTAYYTERARRARYAVDQEALRAHFPTEASVAWLFDLAQRLFRARFVEAQVPVWHPDVRYYDIFDASGKRIAGAYFDLFPREGKYNHAAVWPIRGKSTRIGRTPISVMVANMDRKGLNHNELETLLHEFGHMLHGTLSRTEFNMLAGTSVRRDFVEAPSQMLEEWARKAEPIALIQNHCKDCPATDAGLLKRIDQARRFGAGMHYSRQHILASFDMAMAGEAPGSGMATYRKLEEASPLGFVPGTMFPARFGHLLGGYAAGYYGYMWSEVIALDMASRWQGRMLDPQVSRDYLNKVLSRGGETPPDRMVRDFLGREPSPDAFFAEIAGQRDG